MNYIWILDESVSKIRNAVPFLIGLSKKDISQLNMNSSIYIRYNNLNGFNKLHNSVKSNICDILESLHNYLEKYSNEKSVEDFSKSIGDTMPKGKIIYGGKPTNSDVYSCLFWPAEKGWYISFYLACRMLKLYPKTEKFKEFKRRVEEYLGIEPY